ncbi:hypothetical protein KI688_001424 [Linnemannia hyalina]|uniref:SAM domain-containing protein n=1 Tax=Linnemannia hyalina TaxID=64524 RepID=A0A9P8BSF1_9FUNG|nr:hypothetical protein KI688_001424 [Linnemannia hyalina]
MLSEQGQQQSFDPVSDYSPTMLHQQQHFATGHQQQHQHQKQQQPQQQFHRSARPASEILPQNHHHPFLGNNFQSPEAEAIDKWFEDLSHYEQTLEDMAVVSLDTVFKEELSTIESWFRNRLEAERTAALYSLLQHSSQVQIRFFITVLQQMAKKDPVGALLSPTHTEKGKYPVQNQLHGAMAKAEMEVSQRLLNVLPIQPPAPLDRPTAHRRLYDRHSVTIGESEEYNRMFRQNGKRNSIDFLGRTANSSSAAANNASNNPASSSTGNPNGHANGVIGSAALSESISARVNQFRPAQGSLNRISAPNAFGGRPKSVHEGDTSSMFTSNWNFASLGANPLPPSTSGASSGSTSSAATASSSAGSPGNIGDRTSFGRPKSVGGAEWMLSRPQSAADGLDKSWTPLIMSPTMGGFHNGTNGTGHSLNAGGFSNSGLAVERPKSVTEADLAKLNISQWVHNSNINNGANSNAGSRASALEELKANNRRRTLLRPSAIISNVPVTVMEGDEKLLSASANTSSINIVSTMFNEAPGAGSGSSSMTDLKAAGTTTSSATQGGSSMFSYSGSQPNLNTFSQQQQQAVHQLNNLSLDSAHSARNTQHQQAQQHHHHQQQQQPRSRATSPFSSPLPSPVKSGFRSRPVSGSTSPRLAGQHSSWMAGGSNCNSSNSQNNLVSDGNAMIPTDYNQKRHLSPPSVQRVHPSSSLSLDDDYLSDTSDISSIGMNGHHGRGGSASKEKKQPEGVDFELLQDTPAWLRSLRLHKYNNIFEGMQWRDIVNLSDGDLINKGVAALGARRKMLKVFEQVRKEMLLQGMVI